MTNYFKKLNFSIFLCLLIMVTRAQDATHHSKAQLVTFTNASGKFVVPPGKTWTIYNAFTSYNANDDNIYGICIKSINGKVLCDLSKNMLTYIIFNTSGFSDIRQPLIFPENTKFELLIYKRVNDSRSLYDNTAYLNYVETDN